MHYLTNYYKNLSEQLQQKVNFYNNLLKESMSDYILRHDYDAVVDGPPGSAPKPTPDFVPSGGDEEFVNFPIPPKNWYDYEPGKFSFCLYVPPPCSSTNPFYKGSENWQEWERRRKLWKEHLRQQQQHIEIWTRWKAAYEEWARKVKEWQQRNPGRRYPEDPPYPPSKAPLPPEFRAPKWRPDPPWVIDDRQPTPPGWPYTHEPWPQGISPRDEDDSIR